MPITKESVKNLLEQLQQFKYEYLEKEREITVLRKNLEDTKSSHATTLLVKDQELRQAKETLDLVRKEAETLRDTLDTHRRSSSGLLPDDSQQSQVYGLEAEIQIRQEIINKLESEAAQLRKQVYEMTEELRQTKVQLNESTFKLIKCEEELKTAD